MYSAYRLNKQGDNIQPWRTPFPNCNQSVVLCLVLTVVSWPAYRFLRRQVRWSLIPISWRIFHLRIFQFVVIYTVKGFGIINKAEVNVFLKFSCFFCDLADVFWQFDLSISLLKNFWLQFTDLTSEVEILMGGGFPGGSVAKTLSSQYMGPRFDPCLGKQIPPVTTKTSQATTKILHAAKKIQESVRYN